MIDFLKNFPYPTCRPEQEKVLKEISKNWSTKKYFIIEAPVGTGKSGIAKAIANNSNNAFIITETKQLQQQYVDDFKHENNMVSIKGKANYECNRNPRLNCETGPCSIQMASGKMPKCMATCAYYSTRNKALQSRVVLTSYAYIFRAFDCAGFWKKRQTMIFDEAHLLENQLVNHAQINCDPKEWHYAFGLFKNLEQNEIRDLIKPFTESGWDKNKDRFMDIFKYVSKVHEEMSEEIKQILKDNKATRIEDLDEDVLDAIKQTHKEYYQLDKIYRKMAVFIGMKKDNWIIEPNEEGILVCTPLYVNDLFKKFCNNWADKFIFMSGTILDPDGYIKELGVNPDDCLVIKMDSTFDPAKSPIYFMPCGSMSYKNIDNTLPKVCTIIDAILKSKQDEKGIIHTGNYKVAKYLYNNSKNRNRILFKATDEISNQNLINAHSRAKNSVLMSPSMTTGVDLKDDLSRFQVVIKLPFDSLADNRIKTKSDLDSKWYSIQMLKTLIQACGRSTRSIDDYSTTYILDSSFAYYFNKYKSFLPKDFVNRVKGI